MSKQPRVLLVDDDPAIQLTLSAVLAQADYRVDTAGDGETALRAIHAPVPPDVIVLDLHLPRLDGWQLHIRQRSTAARAIPIIAISADATAQAEAIDADAYLQKPFDPDLLLTTLADVLRARDRELGERAQLEHAERMTTVTTFAAGLSHELSTPLAIVMHNLLAIRERWQALSRKGARSRRAEDSAELEAAISESIVAAGRMGDILHSVRALVIVRDEKVDVRELLQTALRMARSKWPEGVQLSTDLREVPPVLAPSGPLTETFVRLLANAGEALTSVDTSKRRIAVTTARDGPDVVVVVADTGAGMSEATQSAIFDPFFSTKEGGARGLGLWICHRVVAAAHGRIDVESAPGKGARFTLRLPAAP